METLLTPPQKEPTVDAIPKIVKGRVVEPTLADHSQWEKSFGLALDIQEMDMFPDFQWELEEGGLHMYSQESGLVDHVCLVAQAYLKKFHPRDHFSFTWAVHCDRPRIGEFSGGGAFVTARKVYYDWPEGFIERKKKQLGFRRKRGNRSVQ